MGLRPEQGAAFAAETPLTRKLERLSALSLDEIAVLDDLQSSPRRVARRRELVAEGRRYDGVLVLLSGVSLRQRVLHDGRRQVLNVALPGDVIGVPGCLYENALYTVVALTDCLVSAVPFVRLFRLFEPHPRLAATIFCSFSREAAIYAEHLIGVGRRSALERVAHFLLEMLTRLQAVGLAGERSFELPLTQELMGDALGLSVQYVNHTLQQLRADGLMSLDGQQVTINDLDALIALADFEKSYLGGRDLGPLRCFNR